MEVAKWERAFRALGWNISRVAGSGDAERIVPSLAMEVDESPDLEELEQAFDTADLIVVDNLCSIPLNPSAALAVAKVLEGRPAILRHHDLFWQHPRWERTDWGLPTDAAWQHVVISELSRSQMAARGIDAVTAYNTFEPPQPGRRDSTRHSLGVATGELLLLHPTRAVARKNIPGAIALAEGIGATYWLTGDAEMGYGPELEHLLGRAACRVIRGPVDDMADAYAACDAVLFPSTWEGFGNPPIEAALHRRAVAVGAYPVASELVERFGFRWLPADDPRPLGEWLAEPNIELLDHNEKIARENFSSESLQRTLKRLVARWGW